MIVRTVVVPVLSAYALFILLAIYAARHPVPRPPRSEPLTVRTLGRFLRHVGIMEAGGYVVLLAVVLVFGVVIMGGDGEHSSAAGSGLFLLAVATPVFALLSWAEGRWRRPR